MSWKPQSGRGFANSVAVRDSGARGPHLGPGSYLVCAQPATGVRVISSRFDR